MTISTAPLGLVAALAPRPEVTALAERGARAGGTDFGSVLADEAGTGASRDASDARDALDARDASDALSGDAAETWFDGAMRRFTAWCVQRGWWWRWEISWITTTHLGALQNKSADVLRWTEPLFEAYIAGAWILHWTNDTLYWIAKPTVHVEKTATGRRLHNATGPTLESAVENLYFWHGILVPAYAITNPEWITLAEIESETNAEVRRALIERFGYERYCREAKLNLVDSCPADHAMIGLRDAKLWRRNELCLLDVLNSTPEPDGTTKRYVIPVDPDAYGGRAGRECLAATASTWRKRSDPTVLFHETPEDYGRTTNGLPMAES